MGNKLTLQDLPVGKPWYKSKSIWLGILTVFAGVASAAADLLPLLQFAIPPLTYSLLLFFLGLLAIALRLITEQAIARKNKQKKESTVSAPPSIDWRYK